MSKGGLFRHSSITRFEMTDKNIKRKSAGEPVQSPEEDEDGDTKMVMASDFSCTCAVATSSSSNGDVQCKRHKTSRFEWLDPCKLWIAGLSAFLNGENTNELKRLMPPVNRFKLICLGEAESWVCECFDCSFNSFTTAQAIPNRHFAAFELQILNEQRQPINLDDTIDGVQVGTDECTINCPVPLRAMSPNMGGIYAFGTPHPSLFHHCGHQRFRHDNRPQAQLMPVECRPTQESGLRLVFGPCKGARRVTHVVQQLFKANERKPVHSLYIGIKPHYAVNFIFMQVNKPSDLRNNTSVLLKNVQQIVVTRKDLKESLGQYNDWCRQAIAEGLESYLLPGIIQMVCAYVCLELP
jgi:hypothetical protein